jgi:hypothetical protein
LPEGESTISLGWGGSSLYDVDGDEVCKQELTLTTAGSAGAKLYMILTRTTTIWSLSLNRSSARNDDEMDAHSVDVAKEFRSRANNLVARRHFHFQHFPSILKFAQDSLQSEVPDLLLPAKESPMLIRGVTPTDLCGVSTNTIRWRAKHAIGPELSRSQG